MKTYLLFLLLPCLLHAQDPRPLITRYSSLSIPASSRGWAMGNTGLAGSNNNQWLSYNVAGTAFTHHMHQADVHYMPWLPGITSDTRFIHAGYLTTTSNTSALGVNVNYLDMGTVALRNDMGATLGLYKSREYNVGTSYALQLNDRTALGVAMKFLGQNIMDGSGQGGVVNNYSVCGDVGYYQRFRLGQESRMLAVGAIVANLGAGINLPTTAGIGVNYSSHAPDGNQFSASLDATRLIKEGWSGIRISAGAEYGVAEQFFLRGGLSMEHQLKGNRKFFSLGAGYKGFVSDQSWSLDLHCLIPFAVVTMSSPFQNSYGLTISINLRNYQ